MSEEDALNILSALNARETMLVGMKKAQRDAIGLLGRVRKLYQQTKLAMYLGLSAFWFNMAIALIEGFFHSFLWMAVALVGMFLCWLCQESNKSVRMRLSKDLVDVQEIVDNYQKMIDDLERPDFSK